MARNRRTGRRARTTGHRRTPSIQRFTRLADRHSGAAGVAALPIGAAASPYRPAPVVGNHQELTS